MNKYEKYVLKKFNQIFKKKTNDIFFSPAKIDLLGNMLYYVGGDLLSLTVNTGIYSASTKREDKTTLLNIYDNSQTMTFGIEEKITVNEPLLVKLTKCIYEEFRHMHYEELQGLQAYITSSIPNNVNLFYNEALAVLITKMIAYYNALPLTHTELATVACKALEKSLDKTCVIADFISIVAAEENNLIVINTKTNAYDFCPFVLPNDVKMYLLYSNAINSDEQDFLDSDNTDCESLLKVLQKQKINVNSLLDVTADQLDKAQKKMKECQVERIKYFIDETKRNNILIQSLVTKDFSRLYDTIVASHDMLAKTFDVNTSDCNTIVYTLLKLGALSAREIIDNSGNLILFFAKEKEFKKIFSQCKKIIKSSTTLKLFASELVLTSNCKKVY